MRISDCIAISFVIALALGQQILGQQRGETSAVTDYGAKSSPAVGRTTPVAGQSTRYPSDITSLDVWVATIPGNKSEFRVGYVDWDHKLFFEWKNVHCGGPIGGFTQRMHGPDIFDPERDGFTTILCDPPVRLVYLPDKSVIPAYVDHSKRMFIRFASVVLKQQDGTAKGNEVVEPQSISYTIQPLP